jgi:hypothetical protein
MNHEEKLHVVYEGESPADYPDGNQNFLTLILAQLYFTAYAFVLINEYMTQTAIFTTHRLEGNYIQFMANLLVIALLIFSAIYTLKKGRKKPGNSAIIFLIEVVPAQNWELFGTVAGINLGILVAGLGVALMLIGAILLAAFTWSQRAISIFNRIANSRILKKFPVPSSNV